MMRTESKERIFRALLASIVRGTSRHTVKRFSLTIDDLHTDLAEREKPECNERPAFQRDSDLCPIMTSRNIQHRRTHHLLLFHNLLALRESTSLFALVLDTIEQTAKPLLSTVIQNAKVVLSAR